MIGRALRPGHLGLLALFLASVASPSAWSQQPPEPRDAEAAEILFRDGKSLFEARQYAAACPKLAESQRLDPAGGTLLLLALCYEGEGKTASAWSTFNEAAGVARRDKRSDREARSQERIAALEAELSKLTVRVPPALAAIETLEVRRNGKIIPRAVWGSALPVDPGPQHIEATAPGKKVWARDLVLKAQADRQALDVGPLEDLPASSPPNPRASSSAAAPPPTSAPPRDSSEGPSSLRVSSYVVGAVGLVALGGGIYFGIRARSQWNEANSGDCKDQIICADPDKVGKSHSARSSASWSTAGFGLGAAGLVGGLVLFALSGPSTPATALRVVPAVGMQGGGLLAQGGF